MKSSGTQNSAYVLLTGSLSSYLIYHAHPEKQEGKGHKSYLCNLNLFKHPRSEIINPSLRSTAFSWYCQSALETGLMDWNQLTELYLSLEGKGESVSTPSSSTANYFGIEKRNEF